jgi:hypothetical protein
MASAQADSDRPGGAVKAALALPLLALALAGGPITACGGGTASPATGDAGDDSAGVAPVVVDVYQGRLTITGAVVVSGTFTDREATGRTCAGIASSGVDGGYRVPQPQAAVDGASVSVGGLVSDYHGPGSYTGAHLEGMSVTVNGVVFRPDVTPEGTLTVGADAAGSLVFDRWRSGDVGPPSAGTVSGLILWTCAEGPLTPRPLSGPR